ncbi:hypothetical protein [Lentzea sp. NPDC003310]|uniref:hypothetical protein n=1 Tax=Lentzea sp. NPDC003310 TaxID=3154447 RepID=UPI0033AF0B46
MEILNLGGLLFSVVGGLIALLMFLYEYIRGRNSEKSFRPMIGWIIALIGGTMAILAAAALWLAKKSPFSADGRQYGIVCGVGLLLLVGGTLLAILVPSAKRQLMVSAARRVEQFVVQAERRTGSEPRQYVEFGVRPSDRPGGRPRRLSSARLAAGKITVLQGAAGSGKSTALRAYVRRTSNQISHMRRPDELVLYVDLGKVTDIVEPITEATVREHLLTALGPDLHLRDLLAAQFDDASWRWSYAVDLGSTLTADQERQYIDALTHLVSRRPNDRAIVAIRSSPGGEEPHLEIATPTARTRRAMLARRGVHKPVNAMLLHRLDNDPTLSDLATNVDLLALLTERIDAIDPSGSARDMVASTIEACLRDADSLGVAVDVVRTSAEATAFQNIVASQNTMTAETHQLALTGLGHAEHGVFVFRNDVVLAHLAADHLLRGGEPYSLVVALESERWRSLLVAALRSEDDTFRSTFVRDVTTILVDEANSLSLSTSEDAVPLPATFRWPTAALHALQVLQAGLSRTRVNELPDATRTVVDAFIRASMLSGGQAQQRAGVTIIPLGRTRALIAIVDRMLTMKANRILVAPSLRQLAEADDFFTAVPFSTRLRLLAQAFGFGVAPAIAERAAIATNGANSFAVATKDMVHAGHITATIAFTYSLAAIKIEPGTWAIAAAVMAVSVTYSLSFSRWRLGRQGWGISAGGLTLTAMLFCFGGVVTFVKAIVLLLETNVANALTSLAVAWFQTWPIAVILYVAISPICDRKWLLAHRKLFDALRGSSLDTTVTSSVRHHLPLLISPQRVAAAAIGGATTIVLSTNLPFAEEAQNAVKGLFILVAIAAVITLLGPTPLKRSTSWRRLRWDRNHLSSLDEAEVLEELKASFNASGAAITRLLATAASTEPGAMRSAAALFQDLDSLLAFVSDTMPEAVNKPLKEGLWRFAPEFEVPEFRDWIMRFDRRRPGLLSSLATSERVRELSSTAVLKARWP